FAEVLRFDFEQRFGVLALKTGDEQTEKASNQIAEAFPHRVSLPFQGKRTRKTQTILTVTLATLPTLKQIADDLGMRGLANLRYAHPDTVVGVLHKWAVRKFDGHAGIRRAKPVRQRFFLNGFATKEGQERFRGFTLILRTPWRIDNVIGVFVPCVELGIHN